MAGNIARIVAIAFAAEWFGREAAETLYHDYSGFIVFAVAIVLMMAFGRALNTDFREKLKRWKEAHTSTPSPSSS
jgi:exosortase/archaeosortase family protein